MTAKETEELRRWCHGFLDKCLHEKDVGRFVMSHQMKKEVLGYRTGDVYLFSCRECFADSVEGRWRFPDYTTDLNEAAKVEAKAIKTAGWWRYEAYLFGVVTGNLHLVPDLLYDDFKRTEDDLIAKNEWVLKQKQFFEVATASALARCQASRVAVEGK